MDKTPLKSSLQYRTRRLLHTYSIFNDPLETLGMSPTGGNGGLLRPRYCPPTQLFTGFIRLSRVINIKLHMRSFYDQNCSP